MPCTLHETTCKEPCLIRSCVCQAAMMLPAMLLMPCCIQCLCHPLPNAALLHAAADSHLLVESLAIAQNKVKQMPPNTADNRSATVCGPRHLELARTAVAEQHEFASTLLLKTMSVCQFFLSTPRFHRVVWCDVVMLSMVGKRWNGSRLPPLTRS